MGATATMSVFERRTDQVHVLQGTRCYAQIGPCLTILTGSSGLGGLGPLTTRTQLWFRDGQFLFTYSPFTKE